MEINHTNKDIEKLILKFLYENRDEKPVSKGKILKAIKTEYYIRNIDQHLERLKEDRLIKNNMRENSYLYYINPKGITYVENSFTNETGSFDKLLNITNKIEINTRETAINTSIIKETLESVLNSMGIQHQESLREQIETKHLLEEYISLMESNDSDKESKIQGFLKSIGGEIAAPLIVEYLKMKIGIYN